MSLVIRIPLDLRERIEAAKLGEETTAATARRLIKIGLKTEAQAEKSASSLEVPRGGFKTTVEC